MCFRYCTFDVRGCYCIVGMKFSPLHFYESFFLFGTVMLHFLMTHHKRLQNGTQIQQIVNKSSYSSCSCHLFFLLARESIVNSQFWARSSTIQYSKLILIWQRGLFSNVVLGFWNFGYDFWGVEADLHKACRSTE